MKRQLLATLIGTGMGLTAAVDGGAAPGPTRELPVFPVPEAVEAPQEAQRADALDAEMQNEDTAEQPRLRLRIIDDFEYIDAPTDAWWQRVSLYRLA